MPATTTRKKERRQYTDQRRHYAGVGPSARKKIGTTQSDDKCRGSGGGVLRQKIFEFRVSEMAFPAFWVKFKDNKSLFFVVYPLIKRGSLPIIIVYCIVMGPGAVHRLHIRSAAFTLWKWSFRVVSRGIETPVHRHTVCPNNHKWMFLATQELPIVFNNVHDLTGGQKWGGRGSWYKLDTGEHTGNFPWFRDKIQISLRMRSVAMFSHNSLLKLRQGTTLS